MLNNFIYAQTKDLFLNALNAGNILDEAIVFIEDTKEIWNHGHYFAGGSIDPNAFAEMQTEVATISAEKLDKSEAESTYATKEELEEIKWLVLESELITFTINDIEYQAEEGMTWEEWINSEYNNNGYHSDDGEYVYVQSSSSDHIRSIRVAYDVTSVHVQELIIKNRNYSER